ncbi:MAG: nucleotidyltransferase domain-containing protein [Candidatus Aenigmarchaeota archaeon]|nr:nucleotidyltransferase domain-containing protein [Candidatus Aenigmarchaeota archaeon]
MAKGKLTKTKPDNEPQHEDFADDEGSLKMPHDEEEQPKDSKAGAKEKEEFNKAEDEKKRVLILKKFTKEVLKKYGSLVRSVVLFGSSARGSWHKDSDIDVFIILDDTKHKITPAFKEQVEEELDVIAKKLSDKLSVQQPYLLTEFWNMVRIGHPIVFNFIREGVPVFDRDIFLPIKRLLQMGEIKPSKEAVEKYIERAPGRIKRIETAKMYMVAEDCYYAMLESLQAVLMFLGKNPPRPSDAPEAMRKTLVDMKLVKPEFADWLDGVIKRRKDIEHKHLKALSGQELDDWIDKSKKFVKEMQKTLVRVEVLKRENLIEKSYAIMAETIMTILKSMDKTPEKEDELSKYFETYVVKPGLVADTYLEVFNELSKMKKLVKDGKILDLQKNDILMHREYVRKFIKEAGRILKGQAKA